MSELSSVLLFTDVVNGLLSKGYDMIEDNMTEKENCYLERGGRLVKVEIVKNVVLVIGVNIERDDDDSDDLKRQ